MCYKSSDYLLLLGECFKVTWFYLTSGIDRFYPTFTVLLHLYSTLLSVAAKESRTTINRKNTNQKFM